MHPVQPAAQAGNTAEVFNYIAGTSAKKKHAGAKKQHVDKTGDDYPFPQAVFADELVGLIIRLYGYYNFF